MGCDFHWNAVEPDLARQRQAGWLLQSIAKKNDWLHSVFNGPVEGCFTYDEKWPTVAITRQMFGDPESHACSPKDQKTQDCLLPRPLTTHKTTLHLVGVTLFPECEIGGQWSFVFNNSSTLLGSKAHELVTMRSVKDISELSNACRTAFTSGGVESHSGPVVALSSGFESRYSIDVASGALRLALALKR